MGVGGMLVMIPLTSVLYTLAREFTNRRLAERGIPEEKLWDHPIDMGNTRAQKRAQREQARYRQSMQKMKEQFQKMQHDKKKK